MALQQTLLQSHQAVLDRLARKLLVEETVEGEELRDLLREAEIRPTEKQKNPAQPLTVAAACWQEGEQ